MSLPPLPTLYSEMSGDGLFPPHTCPHTEHTPSGLGAHAGTLMHTHMRRAAYLVCVETTPFALTQGVLWLPVSECLAPRSSAARLSKENYKEPRQTRKRSPKGLNVCNLWIKAEDWMWRTSRRPAQGAGHIRQVDVLRRRCWATLSWRPRG